MPDFAFTYRQAIDEYCFLQQPVLPEGRFIKAAEFHGLAGLDSGAFEGLDREGLLPPMGHVMGAPVWHQSEKALLAHGRLRLREDHSFEPWADLRRRISGDGQRPGRVQAVYSYWQLLTLWELHYVMLRAPGRLFHRDGLAAHRAELASRAAIGDDREHLSEIARHGRERDLLLIRTQNLLLPGIHRYWIGGAHADVGDIGEWLATAGEQFDWRGAAQQCEADADTLARHYESLARRGRRLDPLSDWWLLVDQVPHKRRQKLTGDELVALDFYDGARILRGWHSELVDQATFLPDIDELDGPEVVRRYKRRRFGTADVRNNREALPRLFDE